MASRLCGFCSNQSVLTVVAVAVESPWRLDDQVAMVNVAYKCAHCSLLNVAHVALRRWEDDIPRDNHEVVDRFIIGMGDAVSWLPSKPVKRTYADVPETIGSVASEAYKCASTGAPRAAIMLARSVIEASAKAKNVLKGSLEAKIDKLGEMQLLTPHVLAAAHAVRDSGNAVAHGDFAEYAIEIDAEEVDEVLQLMDLILRDVFQSQAQAARVSTRAKERTSRRPSIVS